MGARRARAGAPGRVYASGLVLAVACIGQFMVILDISIVNIALPQMRAQLHLTQSALQWVVNAYTLVFAGFLLLGGRAGDLFGRKRLFLAGLVLFGGASLVAGLAPNGAVLIAARVAQGLGGAVLAPATLAIVSTTYRAPAERARALAVWGAVGGVGGAAGGLLGGVLTEELSWRFVFFVNVPIALAVLVVGRAVLVESRNEARPRLDVPGALLVTAGLTVLVFAIVRTDTLGWASPSTLGALALAAVLLAGFLLFEGLVAPEPLVRLGLFRSRSVTGANLVMVANSVATFPFWVLLSFYLQDGRGDSPLRAGFGFTPATAAYIVGARLASRLVVRFGTRPVLFGAPLCTGIGLLALSHARPGSDFWTAVALPSGLAALGLGTAVTPVAIAATAGLHRDEAGLASGILNTSRQIGGSIGIAVAITLAASRSAGLLHAAARPALAAALTSGYDLGFTAAAGVAFAGAAVSLLVPNRQPATPEPGADTEAREGGPSRLEAV